MPRAPATEPRTRATSPRRALSTKRPRPPRRLVAHPAGSYPIGWHRRQVRDMRREELANALSHGVGCLLALACWPLLLIAARQRGDAASVSAALIFGPVAIVLFLSSTLLHSLPPGRAKRFFGHLDHSAIFLMIAGTYTPFTLGVLEGPTGKALLVAIWSLAAYGIFRTLTETNRPRLIYLGMGWLVVFAARPLVQRMPLPGLILLLAGGIAYTTGFAFYFQRRIPYHHLVWHLFVLLGSACHFLAVLHYSS